MKTRSYQMVLSAIILLELAIIYLAVRSFDLSSYNFWVLVLVALAVPMVLLLLWRSRRGNEIVKCDNCGRTMLYSVFRKAGGCPRCHKAAFTRTGTWPKG